MVEALEFVYSCIDAAVDFLMNWSFMDVPLLVYLMGIAIMGIIIKFIFG